MSLITVIKRTAYIGKFSAHHALIRVKNAHARRAPREQIFCNLKKKSIFPWKCSLSSKYFLFQMWSSSKYSLVPFPTMFITIPWSKWSLVHNELVIITVSWLKSSQAYSLILKQFWMLFVCITKEKYVLSFYWKNSLDHDY